MAKKEEAEMPPAPTEHAPLLPGLHVVPLTDEAEIAKEAEQTVEATAGV